jgi:hypothetical protein
VEKLAISPLVVAPAPSFILKLSDPPLNKTSLHELFPLASVEVGPSAIVAGFEVNAASAGTRNRDHKLKSPVPMFWPVKVDVTRVPLVVPSKATAA